ALADVADPALELAPLDRAPARLALVAVGVGRHASVPVGVIGENQGGGGPVLVGGLEAARPREDAGPERGGRAGGLPDSLDLPGRDGDDSRHGGGSWLAFCLRPGGCDSTHPAFFFPGSTISTRHIHCIYRIYDVNTAPKEFT